MEAAVETSTPPAPKKVSMCNSEFVSLISTDASATQLNSARVLPSVARGDTFEEPEEAATTEVTATVAANLNSLTVAPTTAVPPSPATTHEHTPTVEPDAAPCSGRAFDAFLQLKNSSIYAFRGGKSGFVPLSEPQI